MSLMDLSDTVASLSTGTYTVMRALPPVVVDGVKQPAGLATALSVQASAQAAEPDMMVRMPQGTTLDETKVVYTAVPLYAQSETDGTPADVIAIGPNNFEVQSVKSWGAAGAFWQAMVRRMDPT